MTRLAFLALVAIAIPSCLASQEDLEAAVAEEEQEMRERPEPALPTIDCGKTDNAKCWECGFRGDGIEYCCRDECTIINLPPKPVSAPGWLDDYTYDPSWTSSSSSRAP